MGKRLYFVKNWKFGGRSVDVQKLVKKKLIVQVIQRAITIEVEMMKVLPKNILL